jgi:ribosome-binding ATPase YchF (GTP1/OBG family)
LAQLVRHTYALLNLISFFTTGLTMAALLVVQVWARVAGSRRLPLAVPCAAGEKETRAWTIREGTLAPKAAAEIHSDFEKHFIKADVIGWQQLLCVRLPTDCRAAAIGFCWPHSAPWCACAWSCLRSAGSFAAARDKGLIRMEGKDYAVCDGDVVVFKTSA